MPVLNPAPMKVNRDPNPDPDPNPNPNAGAEPRPPMQGQLRGTGPICDPKPPDIGTAGRPLFWVTACPHATHPERPIGPRRDRKARGRGC